MTVLIRAGEVLSIVKTGQSQIPQDATQFDGTGKFLMPGLWDMHVKHAKLWGGGVSSGDEMDSDAGR